MPPSSSQPYAQPNHRPPKSPKQLLVSAVVCAAIGLFAVFLVRVLQPDAWIGSVPAIRSYDSQAMLASVAPERAEEIQSRITAIGHRFMGSPGALAAAEFIRREFEEAGLEILEIPLQTAAPITHRRSLEHAAPAPEEGSVAFPEMPPVEVFPFFPNHLQPGVTPPEGLEGELVRLTAESIATRSDFSDTIGLIDCREEVLAPGYGYQWMRYAKLGVKAVILSHPEGLEAMPWLSIADRYSGIVSSAPVNFVRLAATPEIFAYVGERVRIHSTILWENAPADALVGVLRAPQPTEEAVFLSFSYDAMSILPDRAPGSWQSVPMASVLSLLRGLAHYRDSLRRDVVIIATGSSVMADDGVNNLLRILLQNRQPAGENRLLRALGWRTGSTASNRAEVRAARLTPILREQAADEARLQAIEESRGVLGASGFMEDRRSTAAALGGLGREARTLVREQFSHVLNSIAFELHEPMLQARIAFERDPTVGTNSPVFQAYLAAKREHDEVAACAGYAPDQMAERRPDLVSRHQVVQRLQERWEELRRYHQERIRRHTAEAELVALLAPYRHFLVLEPRILPRYLDDSPETFSIFTPEVSIDPISLRIQAVVRTAFNRLALPDSFALDPLTTDHGSKVESATNPMPMNGLRMWTRWGYASHSFVNLGRRESYARYTLPVHDPQATQLESIRHSLALAAETVLALAHGAGSIQPTPVFEHLNRSFGGQVLVSNVGRSIVPSHPLTNALIGNRSYPREGQHNFPGYYNHLFVLTNPYGRYRLRNNASDFPVYWRVNHDGDAHTPLAAGFDGHGFIRYMKDEGEDGQRLFKSINVPLYSGEIGRVSIVTFRASAVAFYDLTNPQTMRDYNSIQPISSSGLSRFRKNCFFDDIGVMVSYLEPDQRFFALFQSGTPENDMVTRTRAFALANRDPEWVPTRQEVDGRGYLVADHPAFLEVPLEIGASMAFVNGNRLALQDRYGMSDPRTRLNHQASLAHLELASAPSAPVVESLAEARQAVVFQTLNHPVLRESIMEAVLGILWYLGLLVPFVFFFEKLAFGHTDVRRQVAAQATIFLVVFGLLWVLHPAFQMVRSSLMILLGFIIMMISGGITVIFSGRFRENLEELRKKQGKVTAAEVNVLGVMGSAFMLGLNNMHRRKVRTGLTCATISLLTFVMIAFTSVRNDLVEETVAVGRAPYQGLLIKKDQFNRITASESFAFQEKYGGRYAVCERRMYVGRIDWRQGTPRNPVFWATSEREGVQRRVEFFSILKMDYREPLAPLLTISGAQSWFSQSDQTSALDLLPVFIPDHMAERLGILSEDILAGTAEVRINGRIFRVLGTFQPETLQGLRDLDGQDLLPFDIEAIGQTTAGPGLAQDDDPRLRAETIVIAPLRDLGLEVAQSREIIRSLALSMPQASYREASEVAEGHMIQTAMPLHFGVDGVAWRGMRARKVSLSGLVDLIIPLLIAGLTVLNTMKGSVYERRPEIQVYNAVGIAPRYIFLMFFAEALVYAVVGSVVGYLLSQGTGRILTELGLTGGLNMTFASIATIYASLTIVAAVIASTWFPARSAMEIAAPAEDAGWRLPEPDGDVLAFDLPFNFRPQGRLAVLAFFRRFLLDHGEGGAGTFHAGNPEMRVTSHLGGEYVPMLQCCIWLKPFDLGVSQRLTVSTPPDPRTGLFQARLHLTRISGTRESWVRLNHGFITRLRRQFLHWRAVSPDDRESMFTEARHLLEISHR